MDPAVRLTGAEFREDLRAAPARTLPPEVLRRLTELDDTRSALAVLQTVGLLAAPVLAGAIWWTPWLVAPAVLLIATQQHAMFVLAHDAAHYRLFSNRALNHLVGRLLAIAAGLSMCTYRVVHRLHHNHLYDEQDPDIALHGGYPRGKRYLLKKLATDLTGLTAWKTYSYFFGAPAANAATQIAQRPLDDTAPALRRAAVQDRNAVVAVQVALPLVLGAAFGWSGLLEYLVLWVLPALTVLQAILRLRAIFEHGAPAGCDSPLRAAGTNLEGPFLRLALPAQKRWHVERREAGSNSAPGAPLPSASTAGSIRGSSSAGRRFMLMRNAAETGGQPCLDENGDRRTIPR